MVYLLLSEQYVLEGGVSRPAPGHNRELLAVGLRQVLHDCICDRLMPVLLDKSKEVFLNGCECENCILLLAYKMTGRLSSR